MINRHSLKFPLILLGVFIIPVIAIIIAGHQFSLSLVLSATKLEEDTEFIYYIDVGYDEINNSYDSIYSDSLEVEDVLPEGLTFVEFKNSSIYSDVYDGCSGRINTTPSYDPDTRKITFSVTQLAHECHARVSMLVRSGTTDTRVDHYNTAVVKYKNNYYNSPTVHTFIGGDSSNNYNVFYVINGVSDNDYPGDKPTQKSYSVGQDVKLDNAIEIPGYSFNGWTSSDVTIDNNKFVMPNKDVTITGTYTKLNIQKHKVKYKIEGEGPKNFILPTEREYYAGELVEAVPLELSENIWYTSFEEKYYFYDILVSSNVTDMKDYEFIMPEGDVTVSLIFKKLPYFIEYIFQGNIVPNDITLPKSSINNVESILQNINEIHHLDDIYNADILYDFLDNAFQPGYYGYSAHAYGDEVNLIKDYKSTLCTDIQTHRTVKCRFLGWLYNDKFTMPSHHLKLYGTWMQINGTFEPEIKVEVLNPKDYYEKGDVVEFKTTITNSDDIDIKDLVIDSSFKEQVFAESNDYSLDKGLIRISELKSNKSVEIYSTYIVGENKDSEITNELEIVSALADNEYYLENEEYKATTNFSTRKVGEANPINNSANETNKTIEVNNTTDTNTNKTNETVVPKTSDNAYIYIIVFVISLLAIITIVIVLIKNKKNEK